MNGQYMGTPEDRLTTLPDDPLISILSFLRIVERVALSAVCTRFNRLLPCIIPRLDAFHLDVGLPSGGYDINQEFTFARALIRQCHITFPRALIRQCHIVFRDASDLPELLCQLLVNEVAQAGVQDLILETSEGKGLLNFSDMDLGSFCIRSLRSLSLSRIRMSKNSDHRPLCPLNCVLLTSLKMTLIALTDDFLDNLLDSCPFLETLQLILCSCSDYSCRLCIQSASIRHLVVLNMIPGNDAIDINCSMLDSLVVDVVNELNIEAPKAQTASFFLGVYVRPWIDPSVVALKMFFRTPFPNGSTRLMLNSGTTTPNPNRLTGFDEFICPYLIENGTTFNLDFNLKDQSSTMLLTELLKKCNNGNTQFDIRTDSRHIESSATETARDDEHLLHGLTGSELIKLRMTMPQRTFEGVLSNKKKLKKLKRTGLKMLRRRTSGEQFMNILASEESLFQVSSRIANYFELKF